MTVLARFLCQVVSSYPNKDYSGTNECHSHHYELPPPRRSMQHRDNSIAGSASFHTHAPGDLSRTRKLDPDQTMTCVQRLAGDVTLDVIALAQIESATLFR